VEQVLDQPTVHVIHGTTIAVGLLERERTIPTSGQEHPGRPPETHERRP
jgi:hypothetical protein